MPGWQKSCSEVVAVENLRVEVLMVVAIVVTMAYLFVAVDTCHICNIRRTIISAFVTAVVTCKCKGLFSIVPFFGPET